MDEKKRIFRWLKRLSPSHSRWTQITVLPTGSLALLCAILAFHRTTKTPEKSLEKAEQMAQKLWRLNPIIRRILYGVTMNVKKDYDDAILNAEKGIER